MWNHGTISGDLARGLALSTFHFHSCLRCSRSLQTWNTQLTQTATHICPFNQWDLMAVLFSPCHGIFIRLTVCFVSMQCPRGVFPSTIWFAAEWSTCSKCTWVQNSQENYSLKSERIFFPLFCFHPDCSWTAECKAYVLFRKLSCEGQEVQLQRWQLFGCLVATKDCMWESL